MKLAADRDRSAVPDPRDQCANDIDPGLRVRRHVADESVAVGKLLEPYVTRGEEMRALRDDLSKLANELAKIGAIGGQALAKSANSAETVARQSVARIDHYLAQPLPLPFDLLQARAAGSA